MVADGSDNRPECKTEQRTVDREFELRSSFCARPSPFSNEHDLINLLSKCRRCKSWLGWSRQQRKRQGAKFEIQNSRTTKQVLMKMDFQKQILLGRIDPLGSR